MMRISRLWMLIFVCATVMVNIACAQQDQAKSSAIEVTVMTFNLWHGGEAGGQPLSRTIEVIKAARADIVGLQETFGHQKNDSAKVIAQRLGWRYFDQGDRKAIISRFPIIGSTDHKNGVRLKLDPDIEIFVFNVHLMYTPYQPYQLLDIPYHKAPFFKTEEEAIQAAKETRGQQVAQLLEEVKKTKETGLACFVTGDFNEPSHQDWTEAAVKVGRCPIKVIYPSTVALTDAGLQDAYRTVYPDEVKNPGFTWTTRTSEDDPNDHHDRIDFVFFYGKNVQVKKIMIVGEDKKRADIVLTPYPSDHRAVTATFSLKRNDFKLPNDSDS